MGQRRPLPAELGEVVLVDSVVEYQVRRQGGAFL